MSDKSMTFIIECDKIVPESETTSRIFFEDYSFLIPNYVLNPVDDNSIMITGILKGRAEAQEIYKRLIYTDPHIRMDIFGKSSYVAIADSFTMDQIEQKLNEYENCIKVGDELVLDLSECCHAIATRVSKDGKDISVVFDDGSTSDEEEADKWRKTGRHFDEIELLIKRMKER